MKHIAIGYSSVDLLVRLSSTRVSEQLSTLLQLREVFCASILKRVYCYFWVGLSVFLRTRCEHIANTKAHFIAFRMIFTFRVQSHKISMNQRNIIKNKITWNTKKFYSNRLIIWRSLVQAQAGPHWKLSTYRHSVGAFSFPGDLQVTFLKPNSTIVTFWNFMGLQRIFRDFYLITDLI